MARRSRPSDDSTSAGDADAPTWKAIDAGNGGAPLALYVTGPRGGARHVLPEGLVTLGRGGESTIVIDDPRVSRSHAGLHVDQVMRLTDLGSANGTVLAGRRLATGEALPIAVGETFFIGDSALVVRFTSPRPPGPHVVSSWDEVRERFRRPSKAGAEGMMLVMRAQDLRPARRATWEAVVGEILDSSREWLMWLGDDCFLLGLDAATEADRPRLEREILRHFFSWSTVARVEARLCDAAQLAALAEEPSRFFGGDSSLTLSRGRILLRDPAMLALRQAVARVANAPVNVLVLGETGVGKDVVASMVHEGSNRAARPFVGVNCASLPEALLESELFGHERGAFTGAVTAKPGLLETADGGTVFLDEIGDLPSALQAKLLRAIESRTISRLGAVRSHTVDLRFVAATNRDLQAEVASGRFRRDLFYRLNTVTLTVPPLRDRRSEIEPLARLFLESASARFAIPELALSAASVSALLRHAWPGNVRELRNAIERAVLLCRGSVIEPADLGLPPGADSPSAPAVADLTVPPVLSPGLETTGGGDAAVAARVRIERALLDSAGNQSRAAKLLGMPRRTLVRQIARLKLPRPRKPPRGDSDGGG